MFYEVEPRLKILGIELRGERIEQIFKETPEGIISARKGWEKVYYGTGWAYAKEFSLGWRKPRVQVYIWEDPRDTLSVGLDKIKRH